MAKVMIQSDNKQPITIEIRVVYNDGSEETRREQDNSITIESSQQASLTINGDVLGTVKAAGDLTCGDIDGDVKAGADVTCETINGDVRAGADLTAEDIDGNVQAGVDITCNDISGNARAGADLQCNYVAGSVTAGGEIAAMGFEEDEE